MLELIFFCVLSSFAYFSAGQIFLNKILHFQIDPTISIIFGILILGFVGMLLNFFFPLNLFINTSIFFGLFFYFFFDLYRNKINLKKIILNILALSAITSIILFLSNINRPDAGLYHLPFTKLLNESKIILGASNIHFRFGHTSLIQYSNAVNFNILFKEKGILIPQGLLIISIIYYFATKILEYRKKKIDLNFIFLFFCFCFSILNYNRYSSFGNDAGANLLFLLLIYKTFNLIKKDITTNNIYFLSFISLFCFAQKSFFILSFIIPFLILIFFQKKNFFLFIKSKKTFILLILISILFLKNILISGCIIFPAKKTCFKNLSWYNNITTTQEEIMAEAWAKDWINSDQKLPPKEYSQNFNWFKTWADNHVLIILKKLTPFSLILSFFIIYGFISSEKKIFRSKLNNEKIFIILIIVCLITLCFWFIKFPIYRYGSGIIGGTLIVFSTYLLSKLNYNIPKKTFFIFVLILIFGILVKNSIRIYKKIGSNYFQYPWPKIYSLSNTINELNKINFTKYNLNGEFMFYTAKDGYCMYGPAPCTYYIDKTINKKNKYEYDIFFIKTENKK